MARAGKSKDPIGIQNHLLAALPGEDYQRLLPQLEPMAFELGKVVYQNAQQLEYLYFPTNSMVSLLYTMADGMTAEVGLTGNEGVVGIALFLGGDTTPNQAVVQIGGTAVRL